MLRFLGERAGQLGSPARLLLEIRIARLHAVVEIFEKGGELAQALELQHVGVAVQAQRDQAWKDTMLEPGKQKTNNIGTSKRRDGLNDEDVLTSCP